MKIVHFLFKGTAFLVSLLPFPLLYALSDFISFLLYYIIGYRKKVIHENLRLSFPEKSQKERNVIARRYYRRISDLMVEVIKVRTIQYKTLEKRIRFTNYELAEDLIRKGKSVILVTGHIGNWEWLGVLLSARKGYRPLGVVKPLSDPFFEAYMKSLRLKFASEGMVDFRKAFREMIKYKNDLCMILIAGDQTPTKDEINYWTPFLNQDTPVFLGVEKIAKFLDQAVVFLNMYPVKRGWYEVSLQLITDAPKETAEFEITEAHVRHLEQAIRQRPVNWLWSHRRWKHKRS